MGGDISVRLAYKDIHRGYSQSSYLGNPVFVKHFDVFDYTEIDFLREEAFNDVRKRGLKTEAQQIEWLESKGLWLKKDESELNMHKSYVEELRKSRSKAALKAQADQINKQISEGEAKLGQLSNKRANLVGKTAEQVADQKVQYDYMRLAFFDDPTLTKPSLSKEDLNDLSDRQTDALLFAYIDVINQFTPDILKKIAISPFFTQAFWMCGDDVTRFWDKPLSDLSLYQQNLLSYGSYFKSLMTQQEIPKELVGNPDKIEDFVARSRNMKSLANKATGGDRVALIGATKEDFQALGVEDGTAAVQKDIGREVKNGMEAAKTREVSFNPPRR